MNAHLNRLRKISILNLTQVFLLALCIVFLLSQIFNIKGNYLYLIVINISVFIALFNDKINILINKIKDINIARIYSISYLPECILLVLFTYKLIIFYSNAPSCNIGANECTIKGGFWGGWDTAYSWMLRAYVVSAFDRPFTILSILDYSSADYPVLIPAMYGLLISVSLKLLYLVPLISLISSFLIVYLCTLSTKYLPYRILIILIFYNYYIFNLLIFSGYADIYFSLILVFSFYLFFIKRKLDYAILITLLLPLVKREGLFYMALNFILFVTISKIEIKLLFKILMSNKIYIATIVVVLLLQLYLSNLYGGNELTNRLTINNDYLYHYYNLVQFMDVVAREPFKILYLSPLIIWFIDYSLVRKLLAYLVIIILVYLYVVATLPPQIRAGFYVSVTFDRLIYQIFPILIFVVFFILRPHGYKK